MDIENTLSSPPPPSKDEKEAQKVPDHLHKTGTLKATHKWTGFQGKTLWDWLQLLGVLAIPLVVAGATLGFGWWQVHLAEDQQQATILQTYIDNIQDLLLNHNLLKSKPTDGVAILARARTLTALQGLDSHRKGVLLKFLYEARLIGFYDPVSKENSNPIVDLSNADLRAVDLGAASLASPIFCYNEDCFDVHLIGAALYGADLSYADLSGADLSGADLIHTNLSGADLSGANLSRANLFKANLWEANLSGAWLQATELGRTDITQQQLDQANSCAGADLMGLTCHHQ